MSKGDKIIGFIDLVLEAFFETWVSFFKILFTGKASYPSHPSSPHARRLLKEWKK